MLFYIFIWLSFFKKVTGEQTYKILIINKLNVTFFMNESNLQQEIVLFFRNEYQMHGKGLIFSVPNEATYKNKKYANTGVLSGVSDLVVVLPNKTIFVELKTLKGVQRDKQIKFQKAIESLNHEYHIIRSINDFKKILI